MSQLVLVSSLGNAKDAQMVSALANATLETSARAADRTFGQATPLKQLPKSGNCGPFDASAQLTDASRLQAEPLHATLAEEAEVLRND